MSAGEAFPRVALVTSNFWPEQTGISVTATEFATFLSGAGVDVDVVTAMPYYPQWSIWEGYRGRLYRREQHQGVRIHRCWHFVRRRVSAAVRLMSELSLSVVAIPMMIRVLRRADVVYLISPALTFAWLGSVIAGLFGRQRVVVVKDVMPDAAVELGMLRNRWLIGLSGWLARRLYAGAAEIHTLGEGMRRRIAARVTDPAKIRIVPDTVDGEELYPVLGEANEFRRRYVPDGAFAVLHTGNMGRKQDVDLILRAAELTRGDPTVRYFVFGDGAARGEFVAKRDRLGLTTVSHFPLQERAFLKHMLSGADIVLVSQLRAVVDIVVPSKLLTAMAAGAMIVAAADPGSELARILGEAGGGIVVPAEDERALADAVARVREGRIDVDMHRAWVREYALRHFERQAVYGPIVAALRASPGVRKLHPAA